MTSARWSQLTTTNQNAQYANCTACHVKFWFTIESSFLQISALDRNWRWPPGMAPQTDANGVFDLKDGPHETLRFKECRSYWWPALGFVIPGHFGRKRRRFAEVRSRPPKPLHPCRFRRAAGDYLVTEVLNRLRGCVLTALLIVPKSI